MISDSAPVLLSFDGERLERTVCEVSSSLAFCPFKLQIAHPSWRALERGDCWVAARVRPAQLLRE